MGRRAKRAAGNGAQALCLLIQRAYGPELTALTDLLEATPSGIHVVRLRSLLRRFAHIELRADRELAETRYPRVFEPNSSVIRIEVVGNGVTEVEARAFASALFGTDWARFIVAERGPGWRYSYFLGPDDYPLVPPRPLVAVTKDR